MTFTLVLLRPRLWQRFFFLSILFHHSNLCLPEGLERRRAWLLTNPRMHGIHNSAVQDETDSNWSSGFSFWDRLHGTFRLDVDQDAIAIGVPAYGDPADTGIGRSPRCRSCPNGTTRPRRLITIEGSETSVSASSAVGQGREHPTRRTRP